MDTDRFERIDVTNWPVLSVEQQGSNRNRWIEEPGSGKRWLHKDTIIPANGVEQGEDWAEVVASALASVLGVTHADVRLCLCDDRRGSISLSVIPDGYDLWEGDVMLERSGDVVDYFPHREGRPGRDPSRPNVRRPGHNLRNVALALASALPPEGNDLSGESNAYDMFAGYLLLDALVANRDRHEQNWAALVPRLLGPAERLAPSYDHAGSLGYNLVDGKRERMLQDDAAFATWVHRGTAHRFEHSHAPLTLVDHAVSGLELCTTAGAAHWRRVVRQLELAPLADALEGRAIDAMSVPAVRFAVKLMSLNLERLRDALR